jgi:DNA-directed RNA polymerase subunit E'
VHRKDILRIPPEKLTGDLQQICEEIAQKTFENKIEGKNSYVVLVMNVKPVGFGKVVHGDGAVYQSAEYDAIIFEVMMDEIVCGIVEGIIRFGAFVRCGPLQGLLHISQIMDDRINIDEANQTLLGKETRRDIRLNDEVRCRIVYIKGMNENAPRESVQIGLTMRQPGLGKLAWIEEAHKPKEEPAKKEKSPRRRKKEKGGA